MGASWLGARHVTVALLAAAIRGKRPSDRQATNQRDEMRAMRQIAGVSSQLEKTRLVKKLRAARERKRREAGRCEGRKTRLQRLEKLAKDAATGEAKRPYQEAAKDLQAAV